MGRYVDGFVIPVADDKVEEYRDMATEACEVWIRHGALEYFEGVGDDLDPDTGEMTVTTFPELADASPDETVVFAFIVYESREHRDEVNEKVMADPSMNPEDGFGPMPFDVERMATGGFSALVDREETTGAVEGPSDDDRCRSTWSAWRLVGSAHSSIRRSDHGRRRAASDDDR